MKLPKTLESLLLVNDTIKIRKDLIQHPNDHLQDYYVVSSTDEAVSIIAITASNEVLVTKEYRHAIQKVVTGFPGGSVDANETLMQAAERELLEETGCKAESFEILGSCYPLPGILEQKMTVVLAKGVKVIQKPCPEPTEAIKTFFMTLENLQKHVQEDANIDGIMCMALQFYSFREGHPLPCQRDF